MKKVFILLLLVFITSFNTSIAKKLTLDEYKEKVLNTYNSGNEIEASHLIEEIIEKYPYDGFGYAARAITSTADCSYVIQELSTAFHYGNLDTAMSADAKLLRGYCYGKQKEYKKALADLDSLTYEEILKLNYKNRLLYYRGKVINAIFSKEKGRLESIVYNATKALEMEKTPDMLFYRGLANMQLGEIENAKKDFEAQKGRGERQQQP